MASAAFASPVTRKLWQDRLSRDSKRADLSPDAPLAKVESRKPENISVVYSFSSESILQEQVHLSCPMHLMPASLFSMLLLSGPERDHMQYRSPWGLVRVGKLLEDLDSLAGNIAFRHW